jgi:hypothetical protein
MLPPSRSRDTRLCLAVIGDPHIAIPRQPDDLLLEPDPGRKLHGLSVELLAATVEAVNAWADCEATVVLGDLTRDSETFNHGVARELLSRLRVPYYCVLGNHDLLRERPAGVTYPGEERFDREQTVAFHARGFAAGHAQYNVTLPGGVELIVLDSNRSLAQLAEAGLPLAQQEAGYLGPGQLRWLETRLAAARQAGLTPLVAVHHSLLPQSPAEWPGHPLSGVFRHWRCDDAEAALELLQRWDVRLVLSGHLHAQSVNVDGGVHNLITAAPVSYPHAWRSLVFQRGQIEIRSHPILSIPSCPELQARSWRWMADGMSWLLARYAGQLPQFEPVAQSVADYVGALGWWPRFCNGSLAGFHTNCAGLLAEHPQGEQLRGQLAQMLSEYGRWKAARPDPNTLAIPLG